MPVSLTISYLKNLIEEVVQEKQKPLVESSYSQVINIVRGQKESVYQFGIMTAENPRGKAADPAFNNRANAVF